MKDWLSLKKYTCTNCSCAFTPTGVCQRFCVDCGKKYKKIKSKEYKKSDKYIKYRKEYDRSEKGKEKYRRYRSKMKYKIHANKRYSEMNINVKKARYYIHNAIRDKRIIRPDYCEMCGKKDWGEKRSMIEAHHYLGYEPKNWLSVQWLCTDCHKGCDVK